MIGDDLRPVAPIDGFLAWLSHIERSPNTVRGYALDLKTYWTFLQATSTPWDRPTLERLGEFTAWLRLAWPRTCSCWPTGRRGARR